MDPRALSINQWPCRYCPRLRDIPHIHIPSLLSTQTFRGPRPAALTAAMCRPRSRRLCHGGRGPLMRVRRPWPAGLLPGPRVGLDRRPGPPRPPAPRAPPAPRGPARRIVAACPGPRPPRQNKEQWGRRRAYGLCSCLFLFIHPATQRGVTKQFCPHHKGAQAQGAFNRGFYRNFIDQAWWTAAAAPAQTPRVVRAAGPCARVCG